MKNGGLCKMLDVLTAFFVVHSCRKSADLMELRHYLKGL